MKTGQILCGENRTLSFQTESALWFPLRTPSAAVRGALKPARAEQLLQARALNTSTHAHAHLYTQACTHHTFTAAEAEEPRQKEREAEMVAA